MTLRRILYFNLLLLTAVYPLFNQTNFSLENAHLILKHLCVEIGPRPMGSPAEQQALQFANNKFQEYGCDTSYIMHIDRFSRGNTNTGVAVGIKHGSSKRTIVIGSHIDSAEPEVPGANDDGSGSAIVLELSRVLCKRQLQSTIVFCCFGGEESGLVGSKHFISNFPEIDSITLMLQIDMANGGDILDIDPDAHGSLSAPKWLVKSAIEEYNKLGYGSLRYPTHFFSLNYALKEGPGSDHEPFLQKGIPSLAFVTDVGYPIHTPQDNFENFNPIGLKRSGELVLKLIERYDSGIPSRELEQYWLYIAYNVPIFLPIWFIWLLTASVFLFTIFTFFKIRSRREAKNIKERFRWTSIKIFFLTLIIVSFGWFSSDVIGLIKGVRHPWLPNTNLYYIISVIGAMIGIWIAIRIGNLIRISQCPYMFYKRSVIILIIFSIGLGILSPKLTIEPMLALFLINVSMLISNQILKITFIGLSPFWMLRLIFSEWSELFIRGIAKFDTTEFGTWLIVNLSLIFTLSVYILPFIFAIIAVINDSIRLKVWLSHLNSKYILIILTVIFVSLGTYLITLPTFNNRWQKEINVNEEYDFSTSSKKVNLECSEYLDGTRIHHANGDTVVKSKITKLEINPITNFDTTWLEVERTIKKDKLGDTSFFDIELGIKTKHKPLTISISYHIDGKDLNAFETPFQFRTNIKKEKVIEWYSFPDSVMAIPVKFAIIGNDTVKENIQVTFNRLAYPIEISGEMVNLIPRTKFINNHKYGLNCE